MQFSHSQINLYQTCPRKYAHQYIDRMKVSSDSLHLVLWSAVHAWLERLYEQVRDHKIPSLDDVLTAYQQDWDTQVDETQQRQGPEYFTLEDRETFYQRGINYITWYVEAHHPFDQQIPMDTEHRINIDLDDDIRFRWAIDRLDIDEDTITITDYKTNRSLPKDDNDSIKQQITLYALGVLNDYGSKIKHLVGNVIYLHMKKTVTWKITSEEMENAKTYYKDLAREILQKKKLRDKGAKESFPPQQNFQCNGCPFRMICPLWSHGYKSDEAITLDSLWNTTIKALIDQHSKISKQHKALEAEKKEYSKLLGQYGADNDFKKLYGHDFQLRIGESTRYSINKDTEETLLKKLKEHNLLDDLLSIDVFKLAKLFKDGTLDEAERSSLIHKNTSYSAWRAKWIKDKDKEWTEDKIGDS